MAAPAVGAGAPPSAPASRARLFVLDDLSGARVLGPAAFCPRSATAVVVLREVLSPPPVSARAFLLDIFLGSIVILEPRPHRRRQLMRTGFRSTLFVSRGRREVGCREKEKEGTQKLRGNSGEDRRENHGRRCSPTGENCALIRNSQYNTLSLMLVVSVYYK
jgi:hypothetical protein